MLKTVVDMRVEAASLEAESKALRREANKALRRARRYSSRQDTGLANLSYAEYNAIYNERMATRHEARLHHLTRMLLKGKLYREVEATTYHRVDPEELFHRAWQWDPTIEYGFVETWLEQDVL